jgi:HD-like signal output (HDOD) protein
VKPVERLSPVDFLSHMTTTLASGTVELPAFPQVVIKVQEVLKNQNYTVQTMAQAISTEPRLAARLLNMANSTAFNATGRVIIDLAVALTRLGAQKVNGVVLAHALQEIRRTESLRPIAKQLDDLWSDSIAVAHFCDAVSKRTSLHTPDAFAAGLLHRIGRLYILVQCVEKGLPGAPVIISSQLLDAWEPIIGRAVLKNWQMSESVCDAVGAQADVFATRTGPPTLTDVLIVGMRLAKRMKNSHESDSLSSGGVLARLNLSIEECQSLISDSALEVRALERVFRP